MHEQFWGELQEAEFCVSASLQNSLSRTVRVLVLDQLHMYLCASGGFDSDFELCDTG